MTAQIPDTIEFEGVVYSITGIRGTGLFDPMQHGLQPMPRITSCWRGFVCAYGVADGQLFLTGLRLNSTEAPAEFLGISAAARTGMFDAEYRPLQQAIPFTGAILGGEGFLRELYVHMGFHPAWKFERVRHFTFAGGRLTEQRDRSQEAASFRKLVSKKRVLGELSIGESFALGFDPWAD